MEVSSSTPGVGSIALVELLRRDRLLVAETSEDPYAMRIDATRPHAPRLPHHAASATNVLVIFASGACSHLDTWDYKPELIRRDGEPLPGGDQLVTFQGEQGALTRSPYRFQPRGECGKLTSDLLPRLGDLADNFCFLHSLTTKTNTHGPGENAMSTGFTLDGFPSMGAWTTFALGSESDELPAFVAIPDPRGVPQSSLNNWGAGFLPAVFQGTSLSASQPIRHLTPPAGMTSAATNRRPWPRHSRNPGMTEPWPAAAA
jgi:hypothetical protein